MAVNIAYKLSVAGMGILFMASGWLFDLTGRNGGALFYIGLFGVLIGFILAFFHNSEAE